MATAHMNVKGRTSLDGSGWSAGLRKMEAGTKGAAGRMASSMAGAIGGVFAVGFLTSATRRILQHADQIDKTAKRISTSTDTVQKFDFAATQSGAALTDVEKAFINTSKAIEGAKQGLTTQMRAFQAFGISLQMLQTMSPEQVFLKIAEAIEKAGDSMDRAKSLEDIMGRGGKVLIPAFKGGFAGLMGQAPDPIDAETIRKLAEFNELSKKSEKDLWRDDLDKFDEVYDKMMKLYKELYMSCANTHYGIKTKNGKKTKKTTKKTAKKSAKKI